MRRLRRRGRLTIVGLLVVCVVMLALDANGTAFGGPRDAASSAFGPVERGFDAVVNPVGNFLTGLPDVGSHKRQIDDLRRQNATLRSQLRVRSLQTEQADALRRLGLLTDKGKYRTVATTVLDFGPSFGFEWATRIGVGSGSGVRAGMTVIDADGLVGRVKRADRDTATVVLAADTGSSVGVRVVRTGELGIATGAGLGPMRYTPLNPQSAIRTGDTLVTGPYHASTYAAGVPLGTVTSVSRGSQSSTPSARVRPFVGYTSLDVVAVVLSQQPPASASAAPRTGATR